MSNDSRIESATRFRKKPVVIDAIQFNDAGDYEAIKSFMGYPPQYVDINKTKLTIHTLEGVTVASRGDWIIKGVKGEFYACKADIFALTYEPESVLSQSAPKFDPRIDKPLAYYDAANMIFYRKNEITAEQRSRFVPLYEFPPSSVASQSGESNAAGTTTIYPTSNAAGEVGTRPSTREIDREAHVKAWGEALAAAWKKYSHGFGEVPRGTVIQMTALLSFVPDSLLFGTPSAIEEHGDTPKVDHIVATVYHGDTAELLFKMTELARSLERELTEWKAVARRLGDQSPTPPYRAAL